MNSNRPRRLDEIAIVTAPVASLARIVLLSFVAAVLCAAPARAAEPDAGAAAPTVDLARMQGEIARLKQEVRDQRQLILQLMQVEQQHYDMILKFLISGGSEGLP